MTPRLKSLELHGYKTFAANTVFEFPGNVTAIVGPNGSGKSNISDAIRWVLGEQAFSLLRGKKTEDMIFTGSELRPRSSMAVASIVFNNEDNWLPIDFSEVLITRRAYRDGENEYLLNNQKVRLKEINELLAQTGLAERTYTVIGQGLVDAALSLKPDERRKFFEEAAGIDLYRSRREEAFNRLEATKRNLERVFDILSELTPRIRSLERQAKKVEEYDRVRNELRLLLRDWYGYQWHHAQTEIGRTKSNLKTHETQLTQVRGILDESEKRFSTFREQVNTIRQTLDQWHSESAALHLSREQLSRQLAVFEERLSGLKGRNQEQAIQLGITEEEITSLQRELSDLAREKSVNETKLKVSEKQANEVRAQLAERQKVHDGITFKVTDRQTQLMKAESQKINLNARQIDLDNQIKSAKREMDSRIGLKAKYDAEALEVIDQLNALKSVKSEKFKDVQNLEKDLERIRQETSLVNKQYDEVKELLYISQAEAARFAEQIKLLDDSNGRLVASGSGSGNLLNAISKGQLQTKIDMLCNGLVVPKDLESATSAVLGDYLDALVIENENDLEPILAYIDRINNVKTTLIHNYASSGDKPGSFPKDETIIGNLADLVNPSGKYKNILRMIFSRFLVVKDRSVVQKVYGLVSGIDGCVTLKGEVFLKNGVVIAGEGKNDSRISIPRIKIETETLLAHAELHKKEHSEQLQKLETNRNELKKAGDETQKSFEDGKTQISQLNSKIDQLVLRDEQIKQQQKWINQQQELDTAKVQKFQMEIAEIVKSIGNISGQIELSKKEISALSAEKETISLSDIQTKTIDFDTQNAVFRQSIKNLEIRVMEKQRLQTSAQNRLNEIKQKIAESDREIAELTENRNRLMASEAEIMQKIETIRLKVDPAEADLVKMEKEFQADLTQQESHRQAVTVAERLVAQSQLELARQTGHIDNLRERIEDDFGLVAFEYASNISGPTPLPFDGLVEELPIKEELPLDLEDNIVQLRSHLRRMGPINQEAEVEYRTAKERHEFLTQQTDDLTKADTDLRQVIANLDDLMKKEFKKTFDAVAVEFHEIFSQLFEGGNARLVMTEAENLNESGVDIEARLPGRREQGLSLLSGGERSLTAVALIFALLRVSPTPFCVLDEVDAMLDESNVGRFTEMLRELSQKTQFIIITHNRNTVQAADVIYGVTKGKDSSSQVISLQMDEISEEMAK